MTKNAWLAIAAILLLWGACFAFLLQRQAANVRGVCHAERGFIARQEEQTRSLLSHGLTFGIPKAQLPALIQQSKESQESFLRDLRCI